MMEGSTFSQEESDALAEIFNISFGAAANKLSSRFARQVKIAKPKIGAASDLPGDSSAFKLTYGGDHSGSCYFILDKAAIEATGDFLNETPGAGDRMERVGELMTLIAQTAAVAYEGAAAGKMSFQGEPAVAGPAPATVESAVMMSAGFQFKIEGIVDTTLTAYFSEEFCRGIASDFLKAISGQMDGFDASKVSEGKGSAGAAKEMDAFLCSISGYEDVAAEVTVNLARKTAVFRDLWNMREGDVIGFDTNAREALEVSLSGRVFARGDAVVSREKFAVKITEVRHGRAKGVDRR